MQTNKDRPMPQVRTRVAVQGEANPDREYPPGTIGSLLEALDEDVSAWLVELRLPDNRLVGGYAYDVVTMRWSDLEPLVENDDEASFMNTLGDEPTPRLFKAEDVEYNESGPVRVYYPAA